MFCWMIKYQSTECTDGLSNNDWYECTSKLTSSILSWEYKTWTHEGQNITCFKLEIVTTTINWKVKQKLVKIQQHHLNFQHNFFRIIVLICSKLTSKLTWKAEISSGLDQIYICFWIIWSSRPWYWYYNTGTQYW